jgi:RHS repeat-associated protein
VSEEIGKINWTVYGKVKEIIRNEGSDKPNLKFTYDASGNRIAKIVIPDLGDPLQNTKTWYSRDASGNVMAIYKSEYEANATGYLENIYLEEQPIYGSSRVGERKTHALIKTVDHPNLSLPTELPLRLISTITEHTNLLTGIQQPPTIVWSQNQFSWPYMIPKQGSKKEVNFTNPPPQVSVANANFWGVQGKNICVAEADNGAVQFSAFTARKIGSANNVCRVLDANNNMMLMPLTPIKSNWKAKSLAVKKPGTTNEYYLITVGTDQVPYHTTVNTATNTVSNINTPIDVTDGYGYGMAVIEDASGLANTRLYLRKYNGNNTASIISYQITASGINLSTRTIEKTFNSRDGNGRGEIQIAPNGMKLAIANQKGNNSFWTRDAEIREYNLDANHGLTTLIYPHEIGSHSSIQSLDYSPSSQNIYYGLQGPSRGSRSIMKLNTVTPTPQVLVISGVNGDVRRAKDGNIYVAETNQTFLHKITTPDAVPVANNLSLSPVSGQTSTGNLSLQPHKISTLVNENEYLFTRTMDQKTYEVNDHLGNVRAVVSDVKMSDLDASNNPVNFTPDVKVTNNYYAFGSLQPGRHYSSSDYRYGFNGMEKDDEVNGSTGSSYDFGARMYNSRLGRFFSIDPRTKDLPFYSPYLFASNKPILFIDFNGEIGWPKTSDWSYSDIQGFANFAQTEIARIDAEAVKLGIAPGEPCSDSRYPDVCYDCADFAVALLIRYAAENGKEIAFTLANGTVVSSSETNIKMGDIKREIKSPKDYEKLIKNFANAESLLNDMISISAEEVRIGDFSNDGGHASIITSDIQNGNGNFPVTQGGQPTQSPEISSTYDGDYNLKRFDLLDIKKPRESVVAPLNVGTEVEL